MMLVTLIRILPEARINYFHFMSVRHSASLSSAKAKENDADQFQHVEKEIRDNNFKINENENHSLMNRKANGQVAYHMLANLHLYIFFVLLTYHRNKIQPKSYRLYHIAYIQHPYRGVPRKIASTPSNQANRHSRTLHMV